MTGFALGVWIYEERGSATLYAITLVVSILPRVALSPVAGVVADRWDRRWDMILADTGAGPSSLFVLLMLIMGRLEVWHIYISTLLNSASSTFQWPAYAAATSLLVPKRHLGRASGLTQIGDAISQLAAPAIAGTLYVGAGLRSVVLIDVTTYLVALATLVIARFPQPNATGEGDEAKGSFIKEAVFGWTYIRRRPGLFGLLVTFAVLNFLVSLTFALYTPLILGLTTAEVLGYLNSVAGLGMLVSTFLMSLWGGPRRRVYGIFAAEMVLGLTTFLFGLRLNIPLLAINNFFFMLAMPISNGCSQAIWQSKVEPDIQGRVFAIWRTIALSITPLSYAIAGPLAEQVFEPWMAQGGALSATVGRVIGVGPGHDIALIFILAGALYILVVLAIPTIPRIRRLEVELPDAVG
ncbi:MAG: MFS transporter [Anaerolineae bacterium]